MGRRSDAGQCTQQAAVNSTTSTEQQTSVIGIMPRTPNMPFLSTGEIDIKHDKQPKNVPHHPAQILEIKLVSPDACSKFCHQRKTKHLDTKEGQKTPPKPLPRVMPPSTALSPICHIAHPHPHLTKQTDDHIHHRTHPQTIDGKDSP